MSSAAVSCPSGPGLDSLMFSLAFGSVQSGTLGRIWTEGQAVSAQCSRSSQIHTSMRECSGAAAPAVVIAHYDPQVGRSLSS